MRLQSALRLERHTIKMKEGNTSLADSTLSLQRSIIKLFKHWCKKTSKLITCCLCFILKIKFLMCLKKKCNFFLFASCQVLVSRIRIRFRKIFQPDLDPNYLKKDPQLCGILMHFLNQTARIRKTNLNKKTWILFIYITVSILFYHI